MPERVLWNRLRAGRLDGLKFRRQQPIGPYTVDFYCHEARLVVELDGLHHRYRREHDIARDHWLEGRGLKVMRFTVSWFTMNTDAAVGSIGREAHVRIAQRRNEAKAVGGSTEKE